MFMFAYTIILLQFSELFAWRDGLYFQSLAVSSMLAEKLLYIFCLGQTQTPSVAVPCWACCVRLVVTKQKKGRIFFFLLVLLERSEHTEINLYQYSSWLLLSTPKVLYLCLNQSLCPLQPLSSLFYTFMVLMGFFPPKYTNSHVNGPGTIERGGGLPEEQESVLPVTSVTITFFQEDSKLRQVK